MECPVIPLWFIALATWGAVSAAGLALGALALLLLRLFNQMAARDEPVIHVEGLSKKRRLFE